MDSTLMAPNHGDSSNSKGFKGEGNIVLYFFSNLFKLVAIAHPMTIPQIML